MNGKQQEVVETLKMLKCLGISTKDFAKKTGINEGSLYTYLSRPERMSEMRADYIIWLVRENYPSQYRFISEYNNSLKKN